MSKLRVPFVLLLVVGAVAAAQLIAGPAATAPVERGDLGSKAFAKPLKFAGEVVGTIQYDPGVPADTFRTDTGPGNQIVANQFDSAEGSPLLATGTLSRVTFYPQVQDGNAILSILGPVQGTVAQVLATVQISGVVNGTFNQVSALGIPVGSSFLVGQYLGTFNGPDSVGMRSASYAGQGFHGAQLNFAGSVATNFTTLPGQNTMIRANGNILVPVELMSFEVE